MSLPMRITFEDRDYSYTVLTTIINKDTNVIKISFEGEELTLVKNDKREWDVSERTIGDKHDLIKSIIRNVVLRYRL